MAASNPPVNGTAFIVYVALQDMALPGSYKANPTLAAGDVKVSIDGGAFANLATLPTVTPAAGVAVKVSLSAAEMTGDNIFIQFIDQTNPKEWADYAFNIQTVAAVWNVGKTGYALSGAGVQAIWDALTSALTVVGSIGKRLADDIDATISSRSTYAGGDTAGTTTLLSRLGVPVGASISADIAAIKTVVDAVKVVTDKFVFTIANKVDSSIQAAGDFAQAAADKVWLTTARTLTAFGFSVTVGTNNDKTGYVLTAAYDPAKTAAQAGDAMTLTAAYNAAKTASQAGDAMDLVPDAVDAAAVKADAVAEIQVGLATIANQTTINNNVLAVGAGVGALPTAAQNADKLLGRNLAGGSDGGRTVQDGLRLLRNKRAIAAGTATVFQEDDATPAWTAAVTTAAGNPVTSIDPA